MFTAVTVAFAREKPMLRLQARSLDRFVNWIDEIILIDNESDGCNLQDIIPWYGKHADKVRVLPARKVMERGGPNPYYDQMALKILSHKYCKNDHILLLDSKNWFIKPVYANEIFDGIRYIGEHYPLTDPWHEAWHNSLNSFNLSVGEWGNIPISCRTPFFVGKEILKNLDDELDLWNLICVRRKHTEFTLINACIIDRFKSLDNYFFYGDQNGYCSGVWPGYAANESIAERLLGKEFNNGHIFCTGMHRKAWSTLSKYLQSDIRDGWLELGLLNYYEGNRLIRQMRKLNPKNE